VSVPRTSTCVLDLNPFNWTDMWVRGLVVDRMVAGPASTAELAQVRQRGGCQSKPSGREKPAPPLHTATSTHPPPNAHTASTHPLVHPTHLSDETTQRSHRTTVSEPPSRQASLVVN
jgi:hypothetical protein